MLFLALNKTRGFLYRGTNFLTGQRGHRCVLFVVHTSLSPPTMETAHVKETISFLLFVLFPHPLEVILGFSSLRFNVVHKQLPPRIAFVLTIKKWPLLTTLLPPLQNNLV